MVRLEKPWPRLPKRISSRKWGWQSFTECPQSVVDAFRNIYDEGDDLLKCVIIDALVSYTNALPRKSLVSWPNEESMELEKHRPLRKEDFYGVNDEFIGG